MAGSPAWKVARAGIARTYQTTKLFATMSIIDNVLIALRRGRLGSMAADAASPADRDAAEALLAFVGYHGSLSVPAGISRTSIAAWSRSRARWRCVHACCCSTSPPPA